jgi:2-dehydro-3-deoxyphosphogluconate aldolase/(4S)-4-hydroxy-2-oxoglutarate aldolase
MKGIKLEIKSQFPKNILDKIEKCGVIAVLIIDKVEDAVPTAKALLAGGIEAMELTLRTPAAVDSLIRIQEQVPEMLAGIGTILSLKQVEDIVEAGAAFGVSPGLNPDVVLKAQQLQLPFAPGVATPSELEKAVSLGCKEVKFFPAEAIGGLKYLKSFAAPYKHLGLRYIPLGGLNASNMSDYLKETSVLALGGSWIAKRELILNKDFKSITNNAAEARKIADQSRKGA